MNMKYSKFKKTKQKTIFLLISNFDGQTHKYLFNEWQHIDNTFLY